MLDERKFGLEAFCGERKFIFSAYKRRLSLQSLLVEVHSSKKSLLHPHYVLITLFVLFNSCNISPKQLYLPLLYGSEN